MKEKLAIFILVLFSFTGMSVGSLGKAIITPFHLLMGLLIGYGVFFGRKSNFYTFMSLNVLAIWLLFVNAQYFPNIRYTSILYSIIFVVELTVFYNLIRSCRPGTLAEGFKMILYLYFFNLCVGFFIVTLGLNIPAIEWIIGVARTNAGNRPMGFSSEPSYASFIISVAFLCYNHLDGHKQSKSTVKLWGVYVLSIILMLSAYGFIFLFINILDWLRHYYQMLNSNLKLAFVIICVLMGFMLIKGSSNSQNEALERIERLSSTLSDPNKTTEKKLAKLKEEDPSAFARIGPSYILFWGDQADQHNFYLGAGAGAAGEFIPQLMAGVLIDDDDDELDTGIIPAFIFDYGWIGFALLVLFLINSFYNLPFPFWLSFLMILPNANINTQLFWFAIASYLVVSMVKSTYERLMPESAFLPVALEGEY